MLIKRTTNTGSNGLHVAYRPCTIDELLGNDTSKTVLKNHLDKGTLPHTLLLTGPAGCGKTTAARIIALGLNCTAQDGPTSSPCMECSNCKSIFSSYSMDVQECNVGKESGKADIGAIVENLDVAPFSARAKVIIFDEAHRLTTAAKDLLLKVLEDGYSHVYIIFCTDQPEELINKKKKGKPDPFISRCSHLSFKQLPLEEIRQMLINVLEFEGQPYNDDVLDYIVELTKGVPREALVKLNDIMSEGSWDMEVARNLMGGLVGVDDPSTIELCRALIAGKWSEACTAYAELSKTYSAESIRIVVAGYFVGCLKRSKKFGEARKFSQILDVILDPIYITGKQADNIFYHKMFKVVDLIKSLKGA